MKIENDIDGVGCIYKEFTQNITYSFKNKIPGGKKLVLHRDLYKLAPVKNISKAVPLHVVETLAGESRYSSYSFFTSSLDGGE
jgi:hypothetical protein